MWEFQDPQRRRLSTCDTNTISYTVLIPQTATPLCPWCPTPLLPNPSTRAGPRNLNYPANTNSLAGDEGNELRHALLHGLLRILCNLRIRRKEFFHVSTNVGDGQEPVLLPAASGRRDASPDPNRAWLGTSYPTTPPVTYLLPMPSSPELSAISQTLIRLAGVS